MTGWITTRLLGYLAAFLGACLIGTGVWLWVVRAERDTAVAQKAEIELRLAISEANVEVGRKEKLAAIAASGLLRVRTEEADKRAAELRRIIDDAEETNSCASSPAVGAVLDRLRIDRRPR